LRVIAAERAALAAWRAATGAESPAELVAAVARAGGAPDVAVQEFCASVGIARPGAGGVHPRVPDVLGGPAALGMVHQTALPRTGRRRGGVFYTPRGLARTVVDRAISAAGVPGTACDPAVGGGAFLLAVADAAVTAGRDPAVVVAGLWGADIDPVAVEVSRLALRWWAADHGVDDDPAGRLVVADALAGIPTWRDAPAGFDLVVGNPPFLSQLRGRAVRTEGRRAVLVERFGPAAGGYVDDAALFLLAALDLTAAGGSVALLQPVSVLTAEHAEGTRAAVERRAVLREVGDPGTGWFDASVEVCTVHLDVPAEAPEASYGASKSWADRLAEARGLPAVDVAAWTSRGSLGDVARVTSAFRDQYYGLVPAVTDGPRPGQPRLITVGSVGLLRDEHGRRPVRFARRRWAAPTVDLEVLEATSPRVAAWVRGLLHPKVVVAPQGRLLTCAVDPDGTIVPSVPLSAVSPLEGGHDAVSPWHLAAVLLSPPVSALVARRYVGSGLGPETLRLPARALRDLPLPGHRARWDRVAANLADLATLDNPRRRTEDLVVAGTPMCRMYDVDAAELVPWWAERVRATLRPLTGPGPG